jgi:hypothetical protein
MSNLLHSLLPLAGTALGGAIGYWSAIGVAKRNAHRAAGYDLRAAFATELAKVRNTPHHTWTSLERIVGDPKDDLNEILRAAFERHATAIEKYRFFVPAAKRSAYQAAWQEYYMEEGKMGFQCYVHGKSGQDDFIRIVEAIFCFSD